MSCQSDSASPRLQSSAWAQLGGSPSPREWLTCAAVPLDTDCIVHTTAGNQSGRKRQAGDSSGGSAQSGGWRSGTNVRAPAPCGGRQF